MKELLSNRKFQIIGGIALLLIVGLVVYLFSNQTAPAAPVTEVKAEIIWWNAGGNTKAYEQIVKDFQALPGNRSVNVRIINVDYTNGKDYYQKLITGMAKNNGPDIFTIRNDELPAWKDYLTPITGVFNRTDTQILADYRTNFADIVVQNTVDRDKIYAAANYVDTLQIYYNKTLLQQAKIALPPTTWTEMGNQLSLLNKRDTNNNFDQSAISLGTGFKLKNGNVEKDSNISNFQDIIPTLILQTGGQIYDFKTDQIRLGSERNQNDVSTRITGNQNFNQAFNKDNPAYSALRFYLDFSEPNTTRYSWNNTNKNNIDSFLEGKLAYIINYSDFQATIADRNPRLDYGVSELPQLDTTNKKTYGKYFMNVINRQLEIPTLQNPNDITARQKLQKTREFLYYLTTPSAQEKFTTETNLPASTKTMIDRQLRGDERLKIFAGGVLFAENYYKADVDRAEKMWGNLIYRVQFENKTLDESLSLAINEYNLAVKDGAKIRI